MNINKEQIAQKIADKNGISKKEALQQLNGILDIFEETLIEGDRINLVNFGSFEVKNRKERMGRNPQTKEPMLIAAHKALTFTPGKRLSTGIKLGQRQA